ncbi:MAG TPA: bifunctional ornithine acetyltransferase/N-acetylglutamate synthase [Syntrophorhabdaceae bacterium]|nr:bifunctional ornithine acetyltransferase/N-acetylglutamate synthase [Syntrophorhabdaceae bacterium]
MINGIMFAGYASGIKAAGLDLGLAVFKEPMNCLSLYTRNKIKAAHIIHDKTIEANPVRALLVNSGCANACTGKDGISDLKVIAGELSNIIGVNDCQQTNSSAPYRGYVKISKAMVLNRLHSQS